MNWRRQQTKINSLHRSTGTLDQIHQLTEENRRLQTRTDAAEEHRHRIVANTQKNTKELQTQIKTLQSQHAAILEQQITAERNQRDQVLALLRTQHAAKTEKLATNLHQREQENHNQI